MIKMSCARDGAIIDVGQQNVDTLPHCVILIFFILRFIVICGPLVVGRYVLF